MAPDMFLNTEFESVQGNESTDGQSKEIVDLGTDGRTTSRTEVSNLNIQRVSLCLSLSLRTRLETVVFAGKGLEKWTNDQRSPSSNMVIKP